MLWLFMPFRKPGHASVDICGPMSGGTLKEAKMVRQSRTAKHAYVGIEIGPGVTVEKSRVKCESFQIPKLRFAAEVPTNFAVPCVVFEAEVPLIVDDAVSTVFATM
jgi:hypothetical protein